MSSADKDLRVAASKGRLGDFNTALMRGANVNSQNPDGWTALHWASCEGHHEIQEILLSKGASVDATEKDHWTALHWASREGRLQCVKNLLGNDASITTQTGNGKAAIHLAAQYGQDAVLMALLDHGADPNQKAKDDWTPLHWGARFGRYSVVKTLLRQGAMVEPVGKDGWTPMHWACSEAKNEVVKVLIDAGATIDKRDSNGWSPLHWAVREGARDVVKTLLANKSNAHLRTQNGKFPVHLAAQYGNLGVLQDLLAHGCLINAVTAKSQWSPLHWGASEGKDQIVEYLLSQGATADIKDKDGWTPLHWATRDGKLGVVQHLLRFGASQDIQTGNGKLPIHLAAQYGQDDILIYLVQNGANLTSTSSIGKVPLEYADKSCTKKLIESIQCGGVPPSLIPSIVTPVSVRSDEIPTNTTYRKAGAPVVISLHTESTLPLAKVIQREIEAAGIDTWLCDSVPGGIDFRDQVTMAVQNCKVFLALINADWAESEECKTEFQMAERLFNTDRCPAILPVGLSAFNFKAHPHVFRLSTSTNFRLCSPDFDHQELANVLAEDVCKILDVPTQLRPSDVTDMSIDEVCKMIRDLGLKDKDVILRENLVDGKLLLTMSSEEMREDLKLTRLQARKVKMRIDELQK